MQILSELTIPVAKELINQKLPGDEDGEFTQKINSLLRHKSAFFSFSYGLFQIFVATFK